MGNYFLGIEHGRYLLIVVWLPPYISHKSTHNKYNILLGAPEHLPRCYLMSGLEGDRLGAGAALDLLGGKAALGGAFKGLLLE